MISLYTRALLFFIVRHVGTSTASTLWHSTSRHDSHDMSTPTIQST